MGFLAVFIMKIYKDDGTFYYYYYNKKRGRKKKRGPKKKRKKAIEKHYQKWDFKIIQCDFKKQAKYIGLYHDYTEVMAKKEELLKENESVLIPHKFVNCKRNSPKQYEYVSEYIVLKRIRNKETESNESMLRNEFGRFVKHSVTSENWFIYDKFPCVKEETFWVYGFNPKNERKDIKWIYSNFIDIFIDETYDIVQIYAYNNKIIFRYSDADINFVIAKNVSDAIRIYNFLEEKYKKSKQVIFTGFVSSHTGRANETISLLKEKTGWGDEKIYRKHT